MGAQQAIHQPVRRSYETTGHDQLIIGLGEELHALALEYNRLEEVVGGTEGRLEKIHAESTYDRTFDKMKDICSTLSGFKAQSLEAAAVQLRVISYYSTRDTEEVNTRMSALIFSVAGVLESHGSFTRDQWAGKFFLGDYDPFEKLEA